VLLLLLSALAPSEAHAWTEASVASAQAFVEVDENAQARVSIELLVRIDAGWLEGIEIAGLDLGLALDPAKVAWASTDEPTVKYRPSASIRRDGTVEIEFEGRGRSPRRGTLRIGFVYRADLSAHAITALDDGMLRVEWTLPGWRTGLDAVVLGLSVPSVRARLPERDASSIARIVRGRTRTIAYFERGHLPRTEGWTIAVELPAEDMAESLRAARVEDAVKAELGEIEPHSFEENAWLSGLLSLWTFAVMFSFRRAARTRGARPVALVPIPFELRAVLVLALGAGAPFGAEIDPAIGLAMVLGSVGIGLERTPRVVTRSFDDVELRRATRADRTRARAAVRLERLGAGLALDATTPLGLACLAMIATAAAILSGADTGTDLARIAVLALFAAPPLAATRFHLPPTPAKTLDALARFSETVRTERALAFDLRVLSDGTSIRGATIEVAGASECTLGIALARVLGGIEMVVAVRTPDGPIAVGGLDALPDRRESAPPALAEAA
jgi:hypothetical protein